MPDSPPLQQFKILGQPVHLTPDYLQWLIDRMERGIGSHVVTMNGEIIMQANQQPELGAIIRKADLVTPDGAGVIFALKLHGIQQTRCAGIELGEALLRLASMPEHHYPVFLYGGKPEIVDRAAQNWQAKLPDLEIVGVQHGYINAQEQIELDRQIAATQPKIILVALGVPRQEFWIRDRFHLCPGAIWVGVGGSFDVWSGTKKRAPQAFRKLNLEWLYRLAQEPTRWRRMLSLPHFALLALRERILNGKISAS
jgi:N-acetylglucosaminyldiphosphoundecaprenol N-acetyl-beta-D-mannosaminyltransferase